MSTASPGPLEVLKQLLDAGQMDLATFDLAAAALRAQVTGAGAVAQGTGALAVGAGGAGVGGDNFGTINLGVLIQAGDRPGASAQDLRRAYLARILRQANQLPLFAGDDRGSQVQLSSVYTALLTQRSASDSERPIARATEDHDTKRLSALEALDAEPRLVLLGGPGSGKSTFVNFVAMAMAGELLGLTEPSLATLTAPVPQQDAGHEEPRPQRWGHGALLPVQVVLRDLAAQLPPPGTAVDADTVWQYLRRHLEQQALGDFAPLLEKELLGPGGLVLLDGLDEVPDSSKRREQIKQAVQQFAATFGNCRFVVTSRTYAYQRQEWKLDGFAEVQLQPFTLPQIDRFVDAWYGHMVQLQRLSAADADARANVLKREVERNERIRDLAERPLLLTLIAQLQTRAGGALPEKREELYDKAVEMLLDTWESMKPRLHADGSRDIEPGLAEFLQTDKERLRAQLNRLAFEAHRDQKDLIGTADIPQDKLVAALLRASHADARPRRLEEYLRDRAGILSAHGEGLYQFPHRSFQEYLVACHLTDDEFPDKLAELARADANRWREVVLLAGAKAARGAKPSAWLLSEALCCEAPADHGTGAADAWGALLAGRVLVESADLAQPARRNQSKLDTVRQWQLHLLRGSTLPLVERALAGRTLAALGDPRPEVTTLAGMQFCYVPAGRFLMGTGDTESNEGPQHPVDVPYPYFIGRFPVSVAQWREAVERLGCVAGDERSLRGRDNDPVAFVDWREALRFCDALTEAWQGLLPHGFVVTLPSEAEWEMAARGGERVPVRAQGLPLSQLQAALQVPAATTANPLPDRDYPWGIDFDTERCNSEGAVGETSALGCCPAGGSPHAAEDLSGNVWEWTRSLWGRDFDKPAYRYPYMIGDAVREDLKDDESMLRVVRGGSWGSRPGGARCAARGAFNPGDRGSNLGFRVVLRSSPVSIL